MRKFMLFILSIALIGPAAMTDSAMAAMNMGFTWKSIDCDQVITGISPTDLLNQQVVCAVSITEVIRACINKPGNADPANGQPFQVQGAEVLKFNLGSALSLDKKGKAFSELIFSDEEIKAALPPELVDPALVCPNQNWTVRIAVTKFDAIGELISGAASQPGGVCVLDPNTFNYGSCAVTAGASACTQDECLRYSACTKGSQDFSKPDTFDCTCAEHLKNGSPQNQCKYGIK